MVPCYVVLYVPTWRCSVVLILLLCTVAPNIVIVRATWYLGGGSPYLAGCGLGVLPCWTLDIYPVS